MIHISSLCTEGEYPHYFLRVIVTALRATEKLRLSEGDSFETLKPGKTHYFIKRVLTFQRGRRLYRAFELTFYDGSGNVSGVFGGSRIGY